MSDGQSDGEFERKWEDLQAKVAANRALIDLLLDRVDAANRRAQAGEDAAAHHGRRIGELEAQGDVDRLVAAEFQAEGLLHRDQVAQLEEALRSSRKIGAALGIVMADRRVTEEAAFAMLRRASQETNRKVRVLAEEIVATGDVSALAQFG